MVQALTASYDLARAVREGRYLREVVVGWAVKDLTPSVDAMAIALDPAAYTESLIPDLWSLLPNYAAGTRNEMRLVAYEWDSSGPFTGRVMCTYINAGITIWRGGSGLQTVQTDKYPVDQPSGPSAGTQIEVNRPGTIPADPNHQTQSGVITITESQTSLILERIEPNSTLPGGGIDPGAVSQQYVNTTNSGPWTLDGGGLIAGNPGTWLCENISWDSQGMHGVGWRMLYEFRYRATGWDQEAVYIWNQTGEPAPGITTANGGRRTIRVQGQQDFSNLAFKSP